MMEKTSKKILKYFIVAVLFVIGCNPSIAQTTINYEPTDEIFFNPERGFSAAISSSLTKYFIDNIKSQNVSVVQRIYTIPQFNDKELSQDFLNSVVEDFNTARENGVKLVLRFSYTNDQNGEDAPLDIILRHIEQLKPLFQEHFDVIAYIEAGFIGAWGEWYYSSNNLNNTEDRRTVLFALLDALPKDRCVVIRTPDYKRKIFEDETPLTIEEAYTGTRISRTGAHNDCFLANETDYGTYVWNDIEGDKDYLNQDNMFVPQGGETCCDCGFAGCDNALEDLARMHWSVLNKDYHPDVLARWENEGCMDEVKRRLGYRFELINAVIPDGIKPGGIFNLNFTIYNDGFASPYNPRNLEVVIENSATGEKYRLLTNEDPRFWFSGDTTQVEVIGGIPQDLPEGNYKTYLFLPDPIDSLHDKPDYAIRLANKDVWVDSLGFNSLSHSILISNEISGEDYSGENYFTFYEPGHKGGNQSIIIDGLFEDWDDVPQLDIAPNEEDSNDTEYSSADLVDLWVTDDEDGLFFSFSLAGQYNSSFFYHIFIDADNDTSTGFHSGGSYAGIDLMIENESLWLYTGTNGEWSWSSGGQVASAVDVSTNKRIEVALDKTKLGANSNIIEILFNVNENDENVIDDYAPDNYQNVSYEYEFKITSVNNIANQVPKEAEIIEVYPNPFNGLVNIKFNIDPASIKKSTIYNVVGQKITEFKEEEYRNNAITWNANYSVSSGIYFFVVITESEVYSKKLILIK